MYRHAIAAALFLLPCSCEEGSLRMTKLFHACTLQLGMYLSILSLSPTGGNPGIQMSAARGKTMRTSESGHLERPQEIQKILLLVRL
jgi:hypothetical protein